MITALTVKVGVFCPANVMRPQPKLPTNDKISQDMVWHVVVLHATMHRAQSAPVQSGRHEASAYYLSPRSAHVSSAKLCHICREAWSLDVGKSCRLPSHSAIIVASDGVWEKAG